MQDDDKLSNYFRFRECYRSKTAIDLGVDNKPPAKILSNVVVAARKLDVVRELLACPIIVTSWYRSPRVNRALKGSATGHPTGFCIDFKTSKHKPREIVEMISKSGIKFDQLINEFDIWTHISFDPRMRNQKLHFRK